MITFKSDIQTKKFKKHLKELLDYIEPEEQRDYEEDSEDEIEANKIPTNKLKQTHIYYSIRVLRDFLKQ